MFVYCLYLAGNLLWIPLPRPNAFSYFMLHVIGLSNHMKWNSKCSFIFLNVAFCLTFLLQLNVRAPLHCQASASSSMAWPMSGESHSTLKPVTATLLDAWKRLIITTCNNNNLHLYSANLYMNIFGCALQYCYIKFMSNVTKRTKLWKTTIQAIKNYT